jgi:uncharacterized protein involved in outer membrane biogenesis
VSKYRQLRIISLGIFLASIVALGAAWWSLDGLVENAIVRETSKALGVNVKIKNLQLNPFNGQLAIAQITINNPPGFATNYFMQLDDIKLKMHPLSSLGEVVKIDEFKLQQVALNIEQQLNRNNGTEIASYWQQNQPPSEQRDRGKKFQVNQVAIDRAMATVTGSYLLVANRWNFAVNNIQLQEVTPEKAPGLVLSELSRKLVLAIVGALFEANRDRIPPILQPLVELINRI